ncbi:PepSY domain-containing protein [Alteromonas confluentis]|uniref:PepSY domain-containing protein n=1 Tax=Alteromonas confluentis TaxID=1656094 RepID=A0A1E7Z7K5_9ALTE|nr:PepSY domain-containing protein [Alteromonas confluentis]OFC69421.1 hypothetical protein BFC18_18610 [Alteromonas confluentis]
MNKLVKSCIAASGIMILSAGTAAWADYSDVRAFNEAQITLSQAIAAAESEQGGKAFEAGIDDDSFTPAYEVTVVKDNKVFDVRVDAKSGEVTGVREDYDD